MIRAIAFCAALMLAACSKPETERESANDFADRVGTSGSMAEDAPAPVATAEAMVPVPVGEEVFEVEQIGDSRQIDLGPRDGTCAFLVDGREMLVAAGANERSLPGKASVRLDGELVTLDAPPGGIDQVRLGTTFNGEGFSVLVEPMTEEGPRMTITDRYGQQKAYAGNWKCS